MKSAYRPIYTGIFLLLMLNFTAAFNAVGQEVVRWSEPYREVGPEGNIRLFLNCEGSSSLGENGLPLLTVYRQVLTQVTSVKLTEPRFESLNPDELPALEGISAEMLKGSPDPEFSIVFDRGNPILRVSFIPLRFSPVSGKPEKLVSYQLEIEYDSQRLLNSATVQEYAGTSVLSSGEWFRVAVKETGLHQLTYNDLSAMGMQVAGLNSSAIRVHGYGGGMLPEKAGDFRYDDLPEIPVMVSDGGDGSFDAGDYILFYARGPVKWKFNPESGLFQHQTHLYSAEAYYFITADGQNGRRIQEFPQPSSAPDATLTSYNWFRAYEPNDANLVKSGKEWYGDVFDVVSGRDYDFSGFEPDASYPAYVRLSAAARATQTSTFSLKAAGQTFGLYISPIVTEYNTAYAKASAETFIIDQPVFGSGFNLKYMKPTGSAIGWLNFIEVNAMAKLKFPGGQYSFRHAGVQGIVEYVISDVSKAFRLWDVTDPLDPGYLNVTASNGQASFRALADTLREYVISDDQSYLKPVFVEKVANQNLHGMNAYDMIIVTHPDFASEAARLADFHSQNDHFNVVLLQDQAIYNEFSSGAKDISAIRDFVRMLWLRGEDNDKPRFLLLFGDASYDPLNRIENNSDFIPTFQSAESLHPVTSYATDDFFGCLDDNEGGQASDVPDIGIGRLPVQTPEEAGMAVDKIIYYSTASDQNHGDWRNVIAFVADDGDGNSHMQQADMIASMIDTSYVSYNVDKIFLDAYNQVSTPGGQRIPDATEAINQRMDKGALIVNYTGHGGEVGWAHERVLEVADINSWTNYDKMPVFMTATCEFSRYDDPRLQSAGELVFLNPKGGGIALFTTSRPTFGTPNFTLARSFYNVALNPVDGGMPHLGDLIRISKLAAGADNNSKKFVLLGDPAMKMAYPELNVVTLEINGRDANETTDTLKALSEISVSGMIADHQGNRISDFNGIVIPAVYDKKNLVKTFGTDGSSPMTFSVQRNIIYKGKVNVVDGAFTFSFIVPRDIAYQFGVGKISYYATDGSRDASGYFTDLIVGGFSEREVEDMNGPDVSLYMNDTKFRSGGFTDQNPVMLAYVEDLSGVNTIGNGIGHDIVAILDDQTDSPYILNDFYQSDLNTYQSGFITFPFHNLSLGRHTLRMKVWDVNNNSSEVTTEFIVAGSDGLTLGRFDAWPNPMKENITFEFEHNQAGQELIARLDIFTLPGSKAASLEKRIFAEGFRTTGFVWDGRGSDGHLLSNGFYIGSLSITTTTGLSSQKSVKVIIAR
ncbi:MAG: type IX secretion system sortase PorU [Bacteroidales bacterium]|nr:type IX secretion system sortase PorU [Bacteroidales bacterium]